MWLTEARLVLPDQVLERGSIELHDGFITRIVDGVAPTSEAVSLHGWTIIPGLIDLHGDMIERDIEPRPRALFPVEMAMYELDKRLAATGITTAYAAVSFAWNSSELRRQETAVRIIRTLRQMRPDLLTDCRIHARFEVTNMATVPVLNELLEQGMVDLVSIMDHTPGQGQYSDTSRYVQFLTEWLGFKPEEISMIYERIASKIVEIQADPRDWNVVQSIIETARAHGIRISSHDDDTLAKVTRQATMGVTISEFPVNLAAAQAARDQGMYIVMGAPNAYRGESNTGNLSALEAIRAGLCDILATDYKPAAMLHAAFRLVRDGVLPLHESIRLVSLHPSNAMGLMDRGALIVGRQADLVVVDTSDVHPRVRTTFRRGERIYTDGIATPLFAALEQA